MPLIDRTGDLFGTHLDVLGHGVNLRGIMGAGVAKIVHQRFPSVFTAYHEACGDGSLTAGTAQLVPVQESSDGRELFIANIASQVNLGADANIALLDSGVRDAVRQARILGKNGIALPRIGAGIGGLDWGEVRACLERIADDNPDFIVEVWSL